MSVNLEPVMEVSEKKKWFLFFPFFAGGSCSCQREDEAGDEGGEGIAWKRKRQLMLTSQGHGLEALIRALAADHEAGVAGWPQAEIVALLRDGVAPRGSVLGPMAEVVFRSTSRLDAADLEPSPSS